MKAITFAARNEVRFASLADPKPGNGEAVIDVRASGICHTDLEVLRGNYGGSAFPIVPGHEFAGVVVDVGAGVSSVSIGDSVVVDPNLECGTCRACRRGWSHLCETLGAYGVTRNGGFSELTVVRASALHPVGNLSFHIAALAEPIGCVLNGIEASRGSEAKDVIVFGAGPIGLLMCLALKASGVSNIAVVDIDGDRLALAESFELTPIASGSDAHGRIKYSADLAIDATGVPSVAEDLTSFVANGGTCLYFGVCPSEARIRISPFEIFRRQLSLAGSHSLNHNIPRAIEVIRAIGPDIERIVSHRLSLEDVSGILQGGAPKGSLKVQAAR